MLTSFTSSKLVSILLALGTAVSVLNGQPVTVLDEYIRIALEQSPVLYEAKLTAEQARLDQKTARSHRIPEVKFQMGYQTSAGGRSIDLPVGDMLNGVYSTLNRLTGEDAFPMIRNEKISFFPVNFYDARFRTTVPIYNPEVNHHIEMAGHQIIGSEIGLQLRKRELIARVKEAYFDYLMADQAMNIYEEALLLAEEGRRVNQRLLENGKGLPAYVLRSEAETESLHADIYEAEVAVKNAAARFNFLLNRSPETVIDTRTDEEELLAACRRMTLQVPEPGRREEIRSLKNASEIYGDAVQLNRSRMRPRINSLLDLGSQAENWRIDGQARYFLLGVQLEVPIYSASRMKHKIARAQIDLRKNESRLQHTSDQVRLAGKVALNNLEAALEALSAKEKMLEAASSYRRLITKGYSEGIATFIETIDARNQWTQAQLAYKIQLYKTFKAGAAAERELALFNLDQ